MRTDPFPQAGEGTLKGTPFALRILSTMAALLMAFYLWPLLPALTIAAVTATLLEPLQRLGERRFRLPGLVALLNTIGVFLLVLLPVAGLSILIGREAASGIQWLQREAPELLGEQSWRPGLLDPLLARLGISWPPLTELVADQLDQMARLLAARSMSFVSGLGGWLLQSGVALFTLYYLLRDRQAVRDGVGWLSPLEPDQTRLLLARGRDVIYATVVGNLLVAVVQGVLGGLAFWATGLPSAALWGTVMGVLSLIPVLGPPLVWIPGSLHLASEGQIGPAASLFLFGLLVIATVDNLLRTWLVSGRIRVHPLLVFLGVIGGVFLFGAVGVVVGPVGFVVALALLRMSRQPVAPAGPDDRSAPETPVPRTATLPQRETSPSAS